MRFSKEGREWRSPDPLCSEGLVLYGESEKDLSNNVSKRRGSERECIQEEVYGIWRAEKNGMGGNCSCCIAQLLKNYVRQIKYIGNIMV